MHPPELSQTLETRPLRRRPERAGRTAEEAN